MLKSSKINSRKDPSAKTVNAHRWMTKKHWKTTCSRSRMDQENPTCHTWKKMDAVAVRHGLSSVLEHSSEHFKCTQHALRIIYLFELAAVPFACVWGKRMTMSASFSIHNQQVTPQRPLWLVIMCIFQLCIHQFFFFFFGIQMKSSSLI